MTTPAATSTRTADSVAVNPYSASATRPRSLLIWGCSILAAVIVIGLIISTNIDNPPWQGLDTAVRDLIAGAPGEQNWFIVVVFTELGLATGGLATLLVPMIVLFIMKHWRSALFWLAAFFANAIVIQGLKKTVERPRPGNPIVDPSTLDHGSFPSGHAGSMGLLLIAAAAVLVPTARRYWWWIGAILCLVMSWQRVFVGAHWWTDTLAGISAGAAATLILWWAFYPLIRKDFDRRNPELIAS